MANKEKRDNEEIRDLMHSAYLELSSYSQDILEESNEIVNTLLNIEDYSDLEEIFTSQLEDIQELQEEFSESFNETVSNFQGLKDKHIKKISNIKGAPHVLYMPKYTGDRFEEYSEQLTRVFRIIEGNTQHVINDMNTINASTDIASLIDGFGDIADALIDTLNKVYRLSDTLVQAYTGDDKFIQRYLQESEARRSMNEKEYLNTKLWEARSAYDPINQQLGKIAADLLTPVVKMVNDMVKGGTEDGNKGEIIESEAQNLIESPEDESTTQ